MTAAQERRINREERILRRCPNQNDSAFFNVRQENVLLRAIEPVQFIDKQDRAPAGVGEFSAGLLQHIANLFDAGGHRV